MPDTPDGTVPKSTEFISHVQLVKSPQKAFGNGRAVKKTTTKNVEVDWMKVLSVTLKAGQSDFFFNSGASR